jgi:hypothetical protein
MAEAAAAKAYTDSLTGTIGVDGNPIPAEQAAEGAKAYADSLTGKIKVNADTTKANNDINDAARDRTSTISVSAVLRSMAPGLAAIMNGTNRSVSVSAPASVGPTATSAPAPSPWGPPTTNIPITVNVPAPVVKVAAPEIPPIVVKLDGRPIAALIGSTTAPAVRAAAMRIRAGRA